MATANTTAALNNTQQEQPTPRRHLALNVTCMFQEDRPPVVNPRRRGAYPRGVVHIRKATPKFYPGALCYLRNQNNYDIPVRVTGDHWDDRYWVEAIGGHQITCKGGDKRKTAHTHVTTLFRSAVVSARYQR